MANVSIAVGQNWDDEVLIKAYDKSVNLSKEEIARRIAEKTNQMNQNNKIEASSQSDTVDFEIFKIGGYCRATYDDGIDYEAKILDINELQQTCLIQYVGYENQQEVDLNDIVKSWGKQARREQYTEAKKFENSANRAAKKKTKKDNFSQFQAPNFNLQNGPPFAPFPPLPHSLADVEISDELLSMLMSWYMSGYYTGVYQGMEAAKAKFKLQNK